jgi:hypothetical protein
VLAQIPRREGMPKIEQRADQIADPVERLRYLRHATAEEPNRPRSRTRGIVRHAGWLALAAGLVFAPGPRPKSSAGTFERERGLLITGSPIETSATSPITTDHSNVWRVDRSETSEVYSNGLHVDLAFQISNRPRARYPIFSLAGASAAIKTADTPAGIVFHTTESLLAPFEEDQNRRLKQLGRNLLEVIRQERAYHYLIDRFGRVFSVVAESDAANHAGHSVWAGPDGIYVNLNDSFLAVAFEGQTDAAEAVTPAQIAAGKALTEMLRLRYGIDAANCVTHAQVSVNPDNMRIGAHVDWASDFPFAQIGLPDNYAIPLASLYAFGFKYDDVFLDATRSRWRGLDLAEEQVARQAALEGITVVKYRAMLRHRYQDVASGLISTEPKEQAEAEGVTK